MIKCREGFQSFPAAPFTWRCFQPLQFCFASCAEVLADSSTSASLRTCTRFGDNYRTAGHPVFRLLSGCDTLASAPPSWICGLPSSSFRLPGMGSGVDGGQLLGLGSEPYRGLCYMFVYTLGNCSGFVAGFKWCSLGGFLDLLAGGSASASHAPQRRLSVYVPCKLGSCYFNLTPPFLHAVRGVSVGEF